jgi:flagellar export protein FliJ
LAKFRFSLEVLLKHREDIEQRERDALFRANYAYQVALRDREQLENKRIHTMKELALKQEENTQPLELNWFHLYLNRLQYEIEECEKRITALDAKVQAQKKIVIEATRKKKVLSALKSKQEKEFIAALDKKEQKEVEEWVATRYAVGRNH